MIPTATPLTALSPPDNIAFAPDGTTVTWDAVTDAAGYIIEWFKGDDSPGSHEVTGTSCNIPNFDTTESTRSRSRPSTGPTSPGRRPTTWSGRHPARQRICVSTTMAA
ncbi:MAG: hypothetical protein OXH77_10355 [Anaerolineaceae bacterium]|nr:hypothetical protein [Anaerolineaceae bacterium]